MPASAHLPDQHILAFLDLMSTPLGGNVGELPLRSVATLMPPPIEHQDKVDCQPSETALEQARTREIGACLAAAMRQISRHSYSSGFSSRSAHCAEASPTICSLVY